MSSMYHNGFRSVYKLNAQIVLVVKYRRKVINQEILDRLRVIFADTLSKWDCQMLEFNGELDHVHLLIDKSSQNKDIQQAKAYWQEYLSHDEL